MVKLIAQKTINGELLHFILVEECYSDDDEPFTLFVNEKYYSAERAERIRIYFHSREEALLYCHQEYGLEINEWEEEFRFTYNFDFEYGVTDLGIPQPYLKSLEDGRVIFKLGQRIGSREDKTVSALNISGNRQGLQRLGALLLLCAESEQFDKTFHIHLEDLEGFILPNFPVTLRNPSYFEEIGRSKWKEGSITGKIEE